MDAQYQYTANLIQRGQYYLIQTAHIQNVSNFQDIYNTDLDNFRAEMDHHGPVDWVAHSAWLIKNNYYWLEFFQGFFYLGAAFALFWGILIAYWNRAWEETEEEAKAKQRFQWEEENRQARYNASSFEMGKKKACKKCGTMVESYGVVCPNCGTRFEPASKS